MFSTHALAPGAEETLLNKGTLELSSPSAAVSATKIVPSKVQTPKSKSGWGVAKGKEGPPENMANFVLLFRFLSHKKLKRASPALVVVRSLSLSLGDLRL